MTDEEYMVLFKPELDFWESGKNIYRYRRISDQEIDTLKSGYLWLSFFKDVNDPFDGTANFQKTYFPADTVNLITRVGIEKFRPNKVLFDDLTNINGSSWEPQMLGVIKEFSKYYKMCSFSQSNNNNLMWSHYGDSHRGMVLEFDYRKDMECFGQPYIVRYQGEIPEVNLVSGDPQAIIQLMCTKSSEWEYEQELRIVQPHNGHKLHYNPFALRRIIFGCNTYKEDIEKVKSALHNHSHIIFSQCYMDNSSRMLFVKDID